IRRARRMTCQRRAHCCYGRHQVALIGLAPVVIRFVQVIVTVGLSYAPVTASVPSGLSAPSTCTRSRNVPVGKSPGIGKSKLVVVAGPLAGRGGIVIVRSPASSATRCARPTGGSTASVNVAPRAAVTGGGVLISGARMNAATLDVNPPCGSTAVPRSSGCTIFTVLTPANRLAGALTVISLSLTDVGLTSVVPKPTLVIAPL